MNRHRGVSGGTMLWLAVCYLIILLIPCLPFFGTQAVRLLRESWDGQIKADAKTGIIRPYGATNLAEELFAMLDDKIPQTQVGPVALNPDPGTTPLTINNPVPPVGSTPPDAIKINNGPITFKGPGSGITIPDGGTFNFTGGGFNIDGSIHLTNGDYLKDGIPIGGGGGTGTTVFLGKVVSGTGDTYRVDIYGHGKDYDATAENVVVTIPEIDPDDEIPAGTWINPIFRFTNTVDGGSVTTYQCQPPVWL